MKSSILFVALGLIAGCCSQAPKEEPKAPPPADVVPGALVSDGGVVEFVAEGEAVAKADNELEIARGAAAARTVATANLLGKIKGFRTKGSTTVGDLIFVSQEAYTKVNGTIARADVQVERVGDLVHRARASIRISRSDLEHLNKFAPRHDGMRH
jgi:hypothetical protein